MQVDRLGNARKAQKDGSARLLLHTSHEPRQRLVTYLASLVLCCSCCELCTQMQGMCYSEPVLNGEDREWSDEPADHYDSDTEKLQKVSKEALVVRMLEHAHQGWQ